MDTNMKCQIKEHNSQTLIAVCMNKECNKTQRLCCLSCLTKAHKTHQNKSVEIGQMNAFIKQETTKELNYPETSSYGQTQLIQGLESLMTSIDDFRKIILEKISSLQKLLFERIDSLQKILIEKIKLIKQQNLQQYLKKAVDNQQGIEYWNQLLEGILQYVEVDNCMIKLKTSKEGQLNETEAGQIKIIKQSDQSLQNIISQFTQPQMNNEIPIQIGNQIQIKLEKPQQMKIEKLCFKEYRKHKDIVIIDQSTIKKISDYSHAMAMAMAFANEGFDPKNQSYAFAFNIQKASYQILIGVGNEEGRIAPSYNFGNENRGHGLYMLNTGGYTYHHTDESYNRKQRGMILQNGDKIQIKYDHVTKVLEFRKSSDQTVLTMPITDMTKKLYPCAMLSYIDDQVQLVEY